MVWKKLQSIESHLGHEKQLESGECGPCPIQSPHMHIAVIDTYINAAPLKPILRPPNEPLAWELYFTKPEPRAVHEPACSQQGGRPLVCHLPHLSATSRPTGAYRAVYKSGPVIVISSEGSHAT